jgi:hypothetical protein
VSGGMTKKKLLICRTKGNYAKLDVVAKRFLKNLKRSCSYGLNLKDWIKKNIVNYQRMGEKAHELAKELKIENFTGSDKLMFKFCHRHT